MGNEVRMFGSRVDKMLLTIEQAQENEAVSDIYERIQAWCDESITRKLALLRNRLLPEDYDYRAQCKLIDEDIESRKTPAERKAERRYHAKYPPDPDVRERLIQKVEQYRTASLEGMAS